MVQKIKALSLFLFFPLILSAQVTFKFSANSIDQGPLKNKMENNISSLLSEMTKAGNSGSYLNLSSIDMEPEAKNRLQALWEDAAFVCVDKANVKRCLEDYQGYQVRNIPVRVKPKDNTYNESLDRELTISLDKAGTITGVRLAWELQQDVEAMLKGSSSVTDVRQRREILKWVEDFRSYYNEKNIKSLNQIFSDDALIITGSVVTQRKRNVDGIQYEEQVKYKVQNKEEYLANLGRVFRNNAKINVSFDHISVMKHGAKPNIYGVTLHQSWKSGSYHDEGWLFLLWDFNDPDHPQIHVRTWQPEQIAAQDGLFTLDDFFIP